MNDPLDDRDRETLRTCSAVARRSADVLDRVSTEQDATQLATMLHRAIYNLDEAARATREIYLWLDAEGRKDDSVRPEGKESIDGRER